MKSTLNISWLLVIIVGMACLVGMAILTAQSLLRIFGSKEEIATKATAESEVAEPAPDSEDKSVSAAGEHPFVHPETAVSAERPGPAPDERKATGASLQIISQREQARHETVENLRKAARENPDSDSIPTEKQLKQIEASGIDFL